MHTGVQVLNAFLIGVIITFIYTIVGVFLFSDVRCFPLSPDKQYRSSRALKLHGAVSAF